MKSIVFVYLFCFQFVLAENPPKTSSPFGGEVKNSERTEPTKSSPANDFPAINQNLISLFKQSSRADEGVPSQVTLAAQKLSEMNIPVYQSFDDLLRDPILQRGILHEYFRKQLDWGLPWLPLSWTRELRHSEIDYATFANVIESRLKQLNLRTDQDQFLLGFLLSRTIYHYHDNPNYERSVRGLADSFAKFEKSFYSLRLEIHQEPSLATITKVERYLAERPQFQKQVAPILLGLKRLFAQAGLADFISRYPQTENAALEIYLQAFSSTQNGRDFSTSLLETQYRELVKLGNLCLEVSQQLRNGTRRGNIYSGMDFLGQLQDSAVFAAQSFLEKAKVAKYPLSLEQVSQLTRALLKVAMSSGVLGADSSGKDLVSSIESGNVTSDRLEAWIQEVELLLINNARRLKGVFVTEITNYGKVLPNSDRFVDDLIRDSTLLPVGNLLSMLSEVVQERKGGTFSIDGKGVLGARVLSAGIGKGILVIPSESDLSNDRYVWNPDKIYLLTKTPSTLQKVAGILTCDSGSVVSHVNLLASNHGIANVKVNCDRSRAILESLKNTEVYLIALPNGEGRVVSSTSATAAEIATYKDFNRIKDQIRVKLEQPSRLDIKYPLRLEQLRTEHAGKVAGGKACGQGELAALFPDKVPNAWVLPFGVFNDHIQKLGLRTYIEKNLNDPANKGTSETAVANRSAVLKTIRDRVLQSQLDSNLVEFLFKALGSPPYLEQGVFVRSDTNAEDLPGFVGAGLNETIPNVKGVKNVIDAIKQVWASPFTEKAFSWRNDLIENPWDIHVSVVIQIALNSDVAGVMVVGDLSTDDYEDKVTLAGNAGLGITTVNGEFFPEELEVSRKGKNISQLRKAYAPSQKRLNPSGGTRDLPAINVARLINDSQALELADIGDKVQVHMRKKKNKLEKWDLEWSIIDSSVKLLQLRVFNGNKVARNLGALKSLQVNTGKKHWLVPATKPEFVLGGS